MPTQEDFALALQGVSEGFQGRAGQFAQQQAQLKKKAADDLLKDDAILGRLMLNARDAGQPEVAIKLLEDAIRDSDTPNEEHVTLATTFRTGSHDTAFGLVEQRDKRNVLENLIPKRAQRTLIGVDKGRASFLNPDLTVSEEAVRGTVTPQLAHGDVRNINKDVGSLVRDAVKVRGSAASLRKMNKTKSPTDKLAAVITFMKALDPGSVVQKNEVDTVIATGGLASGLAGMIMQAQGEGGLTDEVFENIVATAVNVANQMLTETQTSVGGFLDVFGDSLSPARREKLMARVPSLFETGPPTTGTAPTGTAPAPAVDFSGMSDDELFGG